MKLCSSDKRSPKRIRHKYFLIRCIWVFQKFHCLRVSAKVEEILRRILPMICRLLSGIAYAIPLKIHVALDVEIIHQWRAHFILIGPKRATQLEYNIARIYRLSTFTRTKNDDIFRNSWPRSRGDLTVMQSTSRTDLGVRGYRSITIGRVDLRRCCHG